MLLTSTANARGLFRIAKACTCTVRAVVAKFHCPVVGRKLPSVVDSLKLRRDAEAPRKPGKITVTVLCGSRFAFRIIDILIVVGCVTRRGSNVTDNSDMTPTESDEGTAVDSTGPIVELHDTRRAF